LKDDCIYATCLGEIGDEVIINTGPAKHRKDANVLKIRRKQVYRDK
jgi:hypothetical protein